MLIMNVLFCRNYDNCKENTKPLQACVLVGFDVDHECSIL